MDNPFTSEFYTSNWLQIFKPKATERKFKAFGNLSFFKTKYLPIYKVSGADSSKGITYKLEEDNERLGNGTFVIYDFPNYFDRPNAPREGKLSYWVTEQHTGFLTDLTQYKSIDDYLKTNFKSKARNRIVPLKRRLENSFEIEYKTIEQINKPDFEVVYSKFYELLKKRFNQKQDFCVTLNDKDWEFFKRTSFEFINNGSAVLFLVLANKKIIGISYGHFLDSNFILANTVFDTDYSKFNLGKIQLVKLIHWCIAKDIKKCDFSKGYFKYKSEWGNTKYSFEYHIFYNRLSIFSKAISYSIYSFYSTKNSLRKMGIDDYVNKIRFLLKKENTRLTHHFLFNPLSTNDVKSQSSNLNPISNIPSPILERAKIEFAFKYNAIMKSIMAFEKPDSEGSFYLGYQHQFYEVTFNNSK